MRKVVYSLILLLLTSCCTVFAKGNDLVLSLDEAIAIAQEQSLEAISARTIFLSSYWEYRTHKAEFLPSLSLAGSLGQYNRSLIPLQNSETGEFNYVENNALNNTLYLSLGQNLAFSGGTLSILSSLGRLDQFASNQQTIYNSQPLYIQMIQPINGYNRFRWERKIEPLKYEKAKKIYLTSLENIACTVVELFFDLLVSQQTIQIAHNNLEDTKQLYDIAQHRFALGLISRDALLQLELNILNDSLSISDSQMDEQIALMRLRSYLGFNDNTNIRLSTPEIQFGLSLSPDDVAERVFLNSPEIMDFDINLLSAEQAVAKAKSISGFSADISVQFGLNQVGFDLPESYKSPVKQEIIGVTLSVPILDWGLGKGRIKVAQAKVAEAKLQISQSITSLRENICLLVMQLQHQNGQCAVSYRAEQVGVDRYNITKDRFAKGVAETIELNAAQKERAQSSLRYINDLADWWKIYYSIEKMTLFDFINSKDLTDDIEEKCSRIVN